MSNPHQQTFYSKPIRHFYRWLVAGLLILSLVVLPIGMAFDGDFSNYPDLSTLLFFAPLAGIMWLALLADLLPLATLIAFEENTFWVKKIGQRAQAYAYSDIVSYNQWPSHTTSTQTELQVYMTHNWFAIKAIDFQDFDIIKTTLTAYGKASSKQRILTRHDRTQFRWALAGLAISAAANIVFGFLAHNPEASSKAKLVSVTATVESVHRSETKGIFKGFNLKLQPWSRFTFQLIPRYFANPLQPLQTRIVPRLPATLLIRQSDFNKKLVRKEPLTFSDKYVDYTKIMVFGIDQGNWLQLMTDQKVYEPPRTNPVQRTVLYCILLFMCLIALLYIEGATVLPTNNTIHH